MAIIRRPNSDKLYYKFVFEGKQMYRSAKTTNEEVAKKRERECRNKLEKEAAMPADQKPLAPAPTLTAFALVPAEDEPGGQWWVEYGTDHFAKARRTRAYYSERLTALLSYAPVADARLDEIDEALLDRYAAHRMKTVKGSTVNRDFAVLRAVMTRAKRWKIIRTLPEFPHFKEKRVGQVVTLEQEKVYLAAVDQDQRDYFRLLIDTGMEPGVAASLEWRHVHFEPTPKFPRGLVHCNSQKNEYRERDLPMSDRLRQTLNERWMRQGRPKQGYVFPADKSPKNPTPLNTFQSVHKRLWYGDDALGIKKFRLYDLRHTFLTRFYQSGATAIDLKQAAGWSSIRMADIYIHADDDSKARAFDRMNAHIENLTSGRTAS